jgi:hypothetical protein
MLQHCRPAYGVPPILGVVQNAGTIARTCAATGVGLHLVKPLGFDVTNTRYFYGFGDCCVI